MRTKRVTIRCIRPIYGVLPNNRIITGVINAIDFTPEQIRLCILSKANVREILPDGSLKVLDLDNYDKFDEVVVQKAPVQVVVEPEKSVAEDTVEDEEVLEEEPYPEEEAKAEHPHTSNNTKKKNNNKK